MNRAVFPARFLALLAVLLWPAVAEAAAPKAETPPRHVVIGYVQLQDDSRYVADSAYGGIVFHTLGRPYPGAELGIADAGTIGSVLGIDFSLKQAVGHSAEELATTVKGWAESKEVHFVLADLPADQLLRLADALKTLPVLLINVSAPEDSLRGKDCRANVAHALPSESMLTDALAQYLVAKNWKDILVLKGPAEADGRMVEALQRSVAKFGAEIGEVRPFALTNDPRHREESNVALMTAGMDADVVFVADSSGEFGRYVPYRISLPRPVVGSAGLVPAAWHWTWYRDGAPQLQHRFERLAPARRMNGEAWAAWVAVKAVTQAAMRTDPADFETMRSFLLGDAIRLDGSKGVPMSFRSWDHQLRQPILLATADAVIAEAPLKQYLHQTNVLDTLGIDAPETKCRF